MIWFDLPSRSARNLSLKPRRNWWSAFRRNEGGNLEVLRGLRAVAVLSPSAIGNLPILSSVPALANGRIELLNYLKEQSVSETVHRYGNLFE